MKKYLLYTGLCIVSCNTSQQEPEEIVRQQVEHNETATTLSKLPATYYGSFGCDFCDSLIVELKLQTDLQYSMNLRFAGKRSGLRDSLHEEHGEWLISNPNTIRLRSGQGNPEYSLFEIVNEDELRLLDSTGSVITDGRQYRLERRNNAEG